MKTVFLTSVIAGGAIYRRASKATWRSLGHSQVSSDEYHDLQSGLIFPSIDHVFSPTLRWAAGLNFDGDQFELILSEPDLESEDPIVLAPLPDCEAVLAWSKDEQTLVCQGSADVRVFKLARTAACNARSASLESGGHVIGEARRVISADGRWFAYDSGDVRSISWIRTPPFQRAS